MMLTAKGVLSLLAVGLILVGLIALIYPTTALACLCGPVLLGGGALLLWWTMKGGA